ncbi:MAG: adenylyl-sulfate kinase [Desulfuromonas sp.]|nr:MAG: adenylyl-sulfate kinase [Desulfuromonas sp.]
MPTSMKQQMNIVIVGHVDHGKSTVIGRLLADTDSLPKGKLQQIRDLCERTSKPFEYAFLLDALKDEQSQGITIDSARVFFKTEKRHYIIIDAPGHIEFLKNMITGASRAEAALLVIDANEGVQENSRRHGYMLGMLGIRKIAVLVNKMDLVGYSQQVFERIRSEYSEFLSGIGLEAELFIPVSGMAGDNVAGFGEGMPWYDGKTVLQTLDDFEVLPPDESLPFRLPVQDVYKFTRFGDSRRIIAGTITSGRVRVGDKVVFFPSGKRTTVQSLQTFPVPESPADIPGSEISGNPVGITLEEQLYVTRGDMVAIEGEANPKVATRLKVSLFWLARKSLSSSRDVLLRIGTCKVRARLEQINRLIDASNLEALASPEEVKRHDVAECVLQCDQPIAFDLSVDNAETGRFVIIDDYEIAGGGIIQEALEDDQSWLRDKVMTRNIKWEKSAIGRLQRAEHYCQRAALVLVTGHEDSRKKEVAKALEADLFSHGRLTYYLGIGSLLYGVDADLKTPGSDSRVEHRDEHLRRFAEVAHLFLDSGMILVATAIDLSQHDLEMIRTVLQRHPVLVVWSGDQSGMPVSADTEVPAQLNVEDGVAHVKSLLQEQGIIFKG